MIAAANKPLRHPNTAFRPIGDEGGLVVLPGRAEVKVLNPVAIKVFGLLDGKHSIDEIAREVTEEFDIDESQAAADIRDFVDALRKNGMLAE
jgi:hypothetical protein